MDKERGEAALVAEKSGSCCTKCHSDVEGIIDVPPDSVAAMLFKHRKLKTFGRELERPYQVPQVMTQAMAGLSRVRGHSARELRGADCGKDCGGAAGAVH